MQLVHCPLLTFIFHHISLKVMPVALQRVTRLLQAADDGLRRTPAVAIVDGTSRRAGAGRVSRGCTGRVARGRAETVGGQVKGRVHRLLIVLQTMSI